MVGLAVRAGDALQVVTAGEMAVPAAGGSACATGTVVSTVLALESAVQKTLLLSDSGGGIRANHIMDEVFDGTGPYSEKLEKVNSPDISANMFAERTGGESRVRFTVDPKARE